MPVVIIFISVCVPCCVDLLLQLLGCRSMHLLQRRSCSRLLLSQRAGAAANWHAISRTVTPSAAPLPYAYTHLVL